MQAHEFVAVEDQARAPADPNRHASRHVAAAASGPTTVAEPADHGGLHHRAWRQYPARLAAADLVGEEIECPAGYRLLPASLPGAS